jgi:deoxyribonuclease V
VYIPDPPHSWSLPADEAVKVQAELAKKVRIEAPPEELRTVAGLDAAYAGDRCLAAVVVWDLTAAAVVETAAALLAPVSPYRSGLLAFREAPALLAALGKLEKVPDVLLCDGHGLAHPRRFGLACHLGLLTGLPALGCAKRRLVGGWAEPGAERGEFSLLLDGCEAVGAVLRTRSGVKPVFVSVGHRIDLESAVELVLTCGGGFRLPEPLRRADRLASGLLRKRA